MTQPTATRRALRDAVARRYGNRFSRLYGGVGDIDSASLDLTSIVDDQLTQLDDFWNSAWLFIPDAGTPAPYGNIRRVIDFNENEDRLFLDRPLSGSPAAGVDYQLFDIFSPYEIHDAINSANREGAKAFPGFHIDEDTIAVRSGILEYALTGLDPAPWRIYNVWVEIPRTVYRGLPTAIGNNTLTDSAIDFDALGVEAGWKLTADGQVRTVSAALNGQLTISSNWTTNPTVGESEYALWDPNSDQIDWRQLIALRFNQPEFPTKMYLHNQYEAYKGMRLRIQYSYKAIDMDADADTTPVPAEFIEPWALKELYQARMQSNRIDRANTASEIERYRVEAETIRQSSNPNEPAQTLWQYSDPNGGGGGRFSDGDPLGWYDR